MTNDELRQEFEAWCAPMNASGMKPEKTDDGYFHRDTRIAFRAYQAGYAKGKEHPCPYVVSSDEGTSYCALAEKNQGEIRKLEDNVILLHEEYLKKDAEIYGLKALLRECAREISQYELARGRNAVPQSDLPSKLKQAGYGNE